MFPRSSILTFKSRLGQGLCLLVAAAMLVLSGCADLDLRGERFPDDSMSEMARRMRGVDEQAESFAFSNKARQIDQNLGVR